ncbi:MAG: hypothetical protein LPK45_04200 [Bacteroidota bacterium]|nr:hypothetical protein [Bacteroidota bacterium]MDX5430255.1 hypothetical protein [Bacteroidota bacterium]MDX5469016.1 hypothetical protein [Bacteroidota bacterium]
MRFQLLFTLFLCINILWGQPLFTPYEQSNGTQTFTYEEGIRFCEQLDSLSPYHQLFTYGTTDAGKPLHVLVFDVDQDFDPYTSKEVVLINNAIHPGEPDGVEASLIFMRDLATNPKLRKRFGGARIVVIPFYNIGGALNRTTHSRANQVGPEEYGFRGNAKNYDLNRDFIKADALNTFAFYTVFHTWNPHVFIDTHVSNGADYQYTMTLINSQEEKYDEHCAHLLNGYFLPELYRRMKREKQEISPYVNVFGTVPDSGITAFMESPRYSNGYTALFDCLSFVSETHMLKPYKERVPATRLLLEQIIQLSIETQVSQAIKKDRQHRQSLRNQGQPYPIPYDWTPSGICDSLLFKGYTATYKPSDVSGLPRLFYDRTKPFEKYIPYCDSFQATGIGTAVRAYVVPAAWKEVITRLAANGVHIDTIRKSDTLSVIRYQIDQFETTKMPYEGHYLHYQTKSKWQPHQLVVHPGDFLITPDDKTEKFLVNVLIPEAPDSYFNWNFFDPILQQKEGFSSYVFEDIAAELLAKNPSLKAELESRKALDPEFRGDAYQQLLFIYQRSPYFEKSYRHYPVYLIPFSK